MSRKGSLLAAGILAVTLVVAAIAGVVHYREVAQMRRINGLLRRGTGFAGKAQAVHELARIPGESSLQALREVAENAETSPDARTEALKAVAARDPASGPFLAGFLKPEDSFSVRMVVAEELGHVECSEECLRAVIRYQERIARGEPTTLDTVADAGFMDRQELARDNEQLNNAIASVVRANGRAALQVLRDEYGFGTGLPSQMGLSIAVADNLQVVCADLNHSHSVLEVTPAPLLELRRALAEAISRLRCSDDSKQPPSG